MGGNDKENTMEQLLIREAVEGEEEAFIQLYHQHVQALYRFVYSKTSNQQDAEDLTSETFFQALKNLRSFSGKSTFKNWLYGIAKHLILAKYRERYNTATLELDENAYIQEPVGQTEEVAAENRQKNEALLEILSALPQNYRQVLELRFLKGYTVLETADAMGITEENAKVLQHRALKKANSLVSAGSSAAP
ncbi:MAG: RNA polymerase sigma factor [Candidatus Gracilibacteria bacterium]